MNLSLPASPGKLIGIVCLVAAALKMFGIVGIKFAATDILLLGLLAVAVL